MDVYELMVRCWRCGSDDVEVQGRLGLCHPCNRRFRLTHSPRLAPKCGTCSRVLARDAGPGYRCPECDYVVPR